MIETILTIRTDNPLGTISPRLYGHFAEPLGAVATMGCGKDSMSNFPPTQWQPSYSRRDRALCRSW